MEWRRGGKRRGRNEMKRNEWRRGGNIRARMALRVSEGDKKVGRGKEEQKGKRRQDYIIALFSQLIGHSTLYYENEKGFREKAYTLDKIALTLVNRQC